ncbi:MAG: hypothetical protein EX272_06365 [Chromatiales bacterium]|nr:MAG: hypothetical protein EX272_06365 [Chromatiales bacterium]
MPMTCVWSTMSAGTKVTLLWQSSQTSVVLICVGCLPTASVPLWQLTQLSVMFAWSKFAGIQAFVVWQSSQVSPLEICEGCLPVAVAPLWQDTQVPMTWV